MLLTLTGRKLSSGTSERRGIHSELVYFVPVLSSRARLCLK